VHMYIEAMLQEEFGILTAIKDIFSDTNIKGTRIYMEQYFVERCTIHALMGLVQPLVMASILHRLGCALNSHYFCKAPNMLTFT
jgi:hypothetical protein